MSSDDPRLRRPSGIRLVDDVRRSLEEAIYSGRMRPGERLPVAQTAERLGVSHTTVREAFLMLERQSLVVNRPRQGTFVTRLPEEEALDICRARALIESYALRSSYDQIDAEIIRQLEDQIEEMRECELPADLPRLIRIDLAFHRILVECGNSPHLTRLWTSLNGQIGALIMRAVEQRRADIEDVVAFHEQLVAAIDSGDPELAQDALVHHYVRGREDDSGDTALIADMVEANIFG